MPREGVHIVRLGSTLVITRQDDNSFKVQRASLELVGIADLKSGNLLTFREKGSRIANMFCSAIELSESELKAIEA